MTPRRAAIATSIAFFTALGLANAKPRLIVETDIGGDRDDQESFIRLLLHSNELEILSIICDRPGDQLLKKVDDNAQNPAPSVATNGVKMAHYYVDRGYAAVADNLRLHDPAYPSADSVREWIVAGYPDVDDGRNRLIADVDALPDGQTAWYMNWGSNVTESLTGETTIESNLKRALDLVRNERGEEGLRAFLRKLHIISLDGNSNRYGHLNTRLGDELNRFIREESMHLEAGWPTMDKGRWYHRFQPITRNAGGFDKALDLSDDHGMLAKLYRDLGQKEGDSWCFVHLLPFGISDPTEPTWGGLAGRFGPRTGAPTPESARGAPFYWNDQRDTLNGNTHRDHTAGRFAEALQNAFRARLDWCTMDFSEANHDPIPSVTVNGGETVTMGVIRMSLPAGSEVKTATTVADPDEGDRHTFQWTYYPEAGSYPGELAITGADSSSASFVIPDDAEGTQIHVYLAATDDGSRKGRRVPNLTRFCRLVIDVTPQTASP